ncbi:MAG: hypothetical protein U0T32_11965 [Chitinophagales bacterium]
MVEFDSSKIYIEQAANIEEKILRIDAVINALLLAALDAASNDGISEYWLDNGQTKIKTVYRSTAAIYASIEAFRKLKEYYVNQNNGRVFRLVDSKNF